jgi:peptide/nickel transport system substrate-binding protein
MKKFIAILMAAILLTTVSGCANKENSGSGSTGDTLVVALDSELSGLDPGRVNDDNSMRITTVLYDRLVTYEEGSLTIVPSLAKEYKISDDGLVYTFTLRDDVTFHNGEKLTADDVVTTFERVMNPDHEFYGAGDYTTSATYFAAIDKVEKTGDYEVVFTLKESKGAFLSYLCHNCSSIISKKALEDNAGEITEIDAGSGPYSLVSWEKGSGVSLKAYDSYWGEKAKTADVYIETVTDALVRVSKLQSGEVDIITEVPAESVEQLDGDGNVTVYKEQGQHVWYLALNNSKAPFDNEKVRQAVSYAIDKEAIVTEILKGTGTPATQVLSPVELGYNKDIEGYSYDPEKAKALLKEAGYEDGFTITMILPTNGSGFQNAVDMATAIQGNLDAVGITMNMEKVDWGTFGAVACSMDNFGENGAYDIMAMAWFGSSDPDQYLPALFGNDAMPFFNLGFYDNQEVTDMLHAAGSASDDAERAQLYADASEIIVDEAGAVFIDWGYQVCAARAGVEGFAPQPDRMLRLDLITK